MVKIVKHPLIQIKLTQMRDVNSDHMLFRNNLKEIAQLMVYEILKEYQTKTVKIETGTGCFTLGNTFEKEIVFVPVLRAGWTMAEGLMSLVPEAKIGHIGIYRDPKTKKVIEYFYKIPNVAKDSHIIVVDPMLATGVSSHAAISKLKRDGFSNIKLAALVGHREGIEKIEKNFKIPIFLATEDLYLNDKKYIIPGLGDAGDRIFGTK